MHIAVNFLEDVNTGYRFLRLSFGTFDLSIWLDLSEREETY